MNFRKKSSTIEIFEKVFPSVILNAVQDLSPLNIRDASLGSA
jgi:hypothetical protein